MLFSSLLSWWYGAGWRDQAHLVSERLAKATDRYSISLLLRSLFAPFRQISADSVTSGSLDARLRAWGDRLISRFIGAFVRSSMIIIGSVVLLFGVIFGVVRLVIWPILPLLPIVGVVMMMSGWVPWQI